MRVHSRDTTRRCRLVVLGVVCCLSTWCGEALGQGSLTFPLPDSPGFYTYSYNTHDEQGWHELEIHDHRGISGWSIDYTWETLDYFMGTFYARSPAGTVFTIGFAEQQGTYSKPTDRFNDEWSDGTWTFWVEDVQGYGEQRALDIVVTIDFVPEDTPFGLIASTYADSARLTWGDAAEQAGLQGYRILRDAAPIDLVPPDATSYEDTGLGLGAYCYTVTAIYDTGSGGQSNEDCTTIYPPGTYGLPDGPAEWFRYDSYSETGWTEVEVIDRGLVENWSLTFTWSNVNGYTLGSLHAESPSGTLLTVGTGLANGTHTIDSDVFDGEPSHGVWRVWIEDDDTWGDGQYRVTDGTMSLDVDRAVPTDLAATTMGWNIVLSWVAPQDAGGLEGYSVYRHDGEAPVGTTDAGTTTYTDADIDAGMSYCYQVAADRGATEDRWPFDACAGGPGLYPVPDSPAPNEPNTYYCDSWTEAGWTEVAIADRGTIAAWHILFDWESNWAQEGRMYAMSPTGTQATIVEDRATGHYEVDSHAFDGEPAEGSWRLWIVDEEFFCDGMYRASNITMSFDFESGGFPGRVPGAMTLERVSDSEILIRWQASECPGGEDYGIYEGFIGSWSEHSMIDCRDDGDDLQETIVASSGDTYYLVVPRNVSSEGSYGRDSSDNERPVGDIACVPDQLLGCP